MEDVLIIGAGPAGLSCAMTLQKAGKSCLLLEKRQTLTGKVCGDGLSSHCIRILESLGFSESDLKALGGKRVIRNITSNFGTLEQRDYVSGEQHASYAYGLSRDVFDSFLLQKVLEAGGKIRFGWNVKRIEKKADGYEVDGVFRARHLVMACGASGGGRLGIRRPKDLPLGISARLRGDCSLQEDAFYFKYDWQYGDGYAWIFPVGDHLWNFGVWSSDRQKEIQRMFLELEAHVRSKYFSDSVYERAPRGALIGASRSRKMKSVVECIGDCDFLADYESGEGISYALESGAKMARAIVEKRDRRQIFVPEKWSFSNGRTILQTISKVTLE